MYPSSISWWFLIFLQTKPKILGQSRHQEAIRKHIEALGGRIEFNTEFSSLTQDDNEVVVTLFKTSGEERTEETARFAYVVGADGGRSRLFWYFRVWKWTHLECFARRRQEITWSWLRRRNEGLFGTPSRCSHRRIWSRGMAAKESLQLLLIRPTGSS